MLFRVDHVHSVRLVLARRRHPISDICCNSSDLEELYFRYTSNPVYVLDASDTCGKVEGLVKLFGSPAGRALVESNNATSPLSNNANSSSASSSSAAQQQEDADKERDGCLVGKTRRKHCRRSSAELYKEAAALLGLACSMTDSCRCIECQVRTGLQHDRQLQVYRVSGLVCITTYSDRCIECQLRTGLQHDRQLQVYRVSAEDWFAARQTVAGVSSVSTTDSDRCIECQLRTGLQHDRQLQVYRVSDSDRCIECQLRTGLQHDRQLQVYRVSAEDWFAARQTVTGVSSVRCIECQVRTGLQHDRQLQVYRVSAEDWFAARQTVAGVLSIKWGLACSMKTVAGVSSVRCIECQVRTGLQHDRQLQVYRVSGEDWLAARQTVTGVSSVRRYIVTVTVITMTDWDSEDDVMQFVKQDHQKRPPFYLGHMEEISRA
uniref:DUF4802 domain-containing protein n=1 Tax=Timema shepardi TaxID=629360 RepID=A0A7R9G0I4_TIMSH|nr:unnamed protein product [Timema shepardi]